MTLDDLRNIPELRDTVADRIWNAFWKADDRLLSDVEAALDAVIAATDYPSFTLVAHEQGAFLGTVTVIERDIEARPQLGPCVAALWVEEAARSRGIAAALMAMACTRLANAGFTVVYLCARHRMRDYYSARGWTLIESGLGHDALDVYSRALP